MRIINLFRGYFLSMILVQGFILGVIDFKSFENDEMTSVCKKSKIISRGIIIFGITAYVLRMFIY